MVRLIIRLLWLWIRSRPSPEMIVSGLCALMLLGFLAPALLLMRERAREHTTRDRLQQIGLSLQNYHDTFRSFPSTSAITTQTPDDEPIDAEVPISPLTILMPLDHQ